MATRRTLEDVATLTDADAIADEYRIEEESQYRPSQQSRLVYFADVHNGSDTISESIEEDAFDMVAKANAFFAAVETFRKANKVKARLAEMIVALSQCTRTVGDAYPYSMSELGDVLGCSHQTARERYKSFLKYESDVKRIAESVGFMA